MPTRPPASPAPLTFEVPLCQGGVGSHTRVRPGSPAAEGYPPHFGQLRIIKNKIPIECRYEPRRPVRLRRQTVTDRLVIHVVRVELVVLPLVFAHHL
jgi:hypothetical protein